jgi:prophage regulatory protein
MSDDTDDDPNELLRPRDLVKITTLSRMTISRLRREQDFPVALRLSKKRIAYRRSDVMDWLRSRH